MTEETVNDEELHRQAGDAALLLEKQIEHRIARAMVNLFAPGNTRLQEKLEEAIAENDLVDMANIVAEAFNKRCKMQVETERNDTLLDQNKWYTDTSIKQLYGQATTSGTLTVPGSLSKLATGGSDNGNSC